MSAEKNPFAKFLNHFKKGTVLFSEGDEGEEMYIIQSGKVAIKKRVPHGDTTLAVLEDGDLIVIGSDIFGDMIKSNPEIAVRRLRKYSLRLRETTKQIEQIAASVSSGDAKVMPGPPPKVAPTSSTLQTEALGYFISISTGNVFPVFKSDALLGRYDSVTGMTPEIDLTNEDQSRNISRRHARLVIKDGKFFVAEEIGTMNGTFLNGQRLPNGVLTPLKDGDELVLCRLGLTFKTPSGK